MKTSQFYWTDKNEKCEIWHEEVNGATYYWIKVDGISQSLTKRQYKNRIKKLEKQEHRISNN
ncbi:MAG: hypothetical protein ACOCWC_04925 [Bacteroidota bacterium]